MNDSPKVICRRISGACLLATARSRRKKVVRRFETTDIRIISLTVVDSADCAIIRLVLSEPERAYEIFHLAKLPFTESVLEAGHELAAKYPAQDFNRQEERIARLYPALVIGREARGPRLRPHRPRPVRAVPAATPTPSAKRRISPPAPPLLRAGRPRSANGWPASLSAGWRRVTAAICGSHAPTGRRPACGT